MSVFYKTSSGNGKRQMQAADAQHHFRSTDIKIPARNPDWHGRGIREAIYIHGLSPSLNANDGCHMLPNCYDSIIKQSIKKPETLKPDEPRLNNAKRGPGRPRNQPYQETLAKTVELPTVQREGCGAHLINFCSAFPPSVSYPTV